MSETINAAAGLLAAFAAAASSVPIAPAPSGDPAAAPLARAFGNTIVSTYPDGRHQSLWLRPDGGWSGVARTGKPLAGRWRLNGNKVCLRQTEPPTLPFSYCAAFPAAVDVGSTWMSKDFLGRPISLKLEAGTRPAAKSLGGGA